MEALVLGDIVLGRILFEEVFPDYTEHKLESTENGCLLIVAENTDGRVVKAKFRRESSRTGSFLMMYDAFFGKYIKSVRV